MNEFFGRIVPACCNNPVLVASFWAFVVGSGVITTGCEGGSDVLGDGNCYEYAESVRAIDSFTQPLSGMERTPAEVVALHEQGHPIEVVSESDTQVRWEGQVRAVPLDDVGTFRQYDEGCPGREILTVPARYDFDRTGDAGPFFSVTGWLEISAAAREETLFVWNDAPVAMSDAFVQEFMADPQLDATRNVFTLNVHTDPDYGFCGEFKVREPGATDAYAAGILLRTPTDAEDCQGSGPP